MFIYTGGNHMHSRVIQIHLEWYGYMCPKYDKLPVGL